MNETKPLLSDRTANTITTNNSNNKMNDFSFTTTRSSSTISSTLRWTTNAMSLVSVLLFSGLILGWAPLELMLTREGQYNEYCVSDEETKLCPEQSIRLQRIFTVAQFLMNFASLPIGYLVDYIPSKGLYFAMTAVVQVTGLLIFAASDSLTFDYFTVGYGLMAVGGSMALVGSFPASFLLPEYQLGLLAMISCLFDASSAVLFVFHRLNVSNSELYTRRMLFASLGCIGIVVYGLLATCWTLLELKHWKDVIAIEELETEKKKNNNNNNTLLPTTENCDNNNDRQKDHPHIIGLPIWEQLQTSEFMLVAIFSSIHILRCNYYVMTIDDFLYYFLGDSDGYYADVFSYVLPSGILFFPLIEQTLVRVGITRSLHITNILGVVFGILVLIPSLKLQVFTFFVFTGFNAFLNSTVNTFIAVYFGVETTGRIVGCSYTACAFVSLLQYPAAMYSSSGGWFRVNAVFLAICIIPILRVRFYHNSKQQKSSSKKLTLA